MRGVVILGNGTYVGKTYGGVGPARALRERDPTAAALALKTSAGPKNAIRPTQPPTRN